MYFHMNFKLVFGFSPVFLPFVEDFRLILMYLSVLWRFLLLIISFVSINAIISDLPKRENVS